MTRSPKAKNKPESESRSVKHKPSVLMFSFSVWGVFWCFWLMFEYRVIKQIKHLRSLVLKDASGSVYWLVLCCVFPVRLWTSPYCHLFSQNECLALNIWYYVCLDMDSSPGRKKGHSISARFSLVETSFAGMGLTFYLKPVMYNGCNMCAFN